MKTAKYQAELLACLFLMLMDRYFFDLLRWTLGRVERTARAGARNSGTAMITQRGNWQSARSCPIVAVRLFEGSES